VFKNGRMVYSNFRSLSISEKYDLDNLDILILKLLLKSPHRLEMKKIIENIEYPEIEVKLRIHSLLLKGYIRQDSREEVKWDSNSATFYTNSTFREEIRGLTEI